MRTDWMPSKSTAPSLGPKTLSQVRVQALAAAVEVKEVRVGPNQGCNPAGLHTHSFTIYRCPTRQADILVDPKHGLTSRRTPKTNLPPL